MLLYKLETLMIGMSLKIFKADYKTTFKKELFSPAGQFSAIELPNIRKI